MYFNFLANNCHLEYLYFTYTTYSTIISYISTKRKTKSPYWRTFLFFFLSEKDQKSGDRLGISAFLNVFNLQMLTCRLICWLDFVQNVGRAEYDDAAVLETDTLPGLVSFKISCPVRSIGHRAEQARKDQNKSQKTEQPAPHWKSSPAGALSAGTSLPFWLDRTQVRTPATMDRSPTPRMPSTMFAIPIPWEPVR